MEWWELDLEPWLPRVAALVDLSPCWQFYSGAGFCINAGEISYPGSGPLPPLEEEGSDFRFRRMGVVDMTFTTFCCWKIEKYKE